MERDRFWGIGMLVIIDEREIVTSGYTCRFGSEEFPRQASARRFPRMGDNGRRNRPWRRGGLSYRRLQRSPDLPEIIRERSRAPVIAMNETPSLEQTLDLFAAGVDDVVRKPVHVREILARVGAIKRRRNQQGDSVAIGDLRVFFDGRDPELNGRILVLPRRERRILEYLVNNRGRRVSKAQIFNSIYGIFDENVEENVVESHISKLRKKLRVQLGYDPINSVRYLGYRLDGST